MMMKGDEVQLMSTAAQKDGARNDKIGLFSLPWGSMEHCTKRQRHKKVIICKSPAHLWVALLFRDCHSFVCWDFIFLPDPL